MKNLRMFAVALLSLIATSAFAQQKEIILLAHRGGCGEGMENVEGTFKKSLEAGIRAFEIDVRITKDGKIVLQHDNTLKRTAGIDRKVEDMTEKELREVTLKDGSKLFFLDEFLKLMSKYPGLFIEFEMKSSKYTDEFLYSSGYSDKVAKMVLKAKPAESTYVFTSFDTRPLRYIKEHYPAAETGYITGAGVNHETIAIALAIGAKRMAAHIDRTTRADMDRAHRKGLLGNLCPGKSDDSLVRAWSLGADIHCTDYPSHMLKLARENYKWFTIK